MKNIVTTYNKKLWYTLILLFMPGLIFAQDGGSLSFSPPPGDYSVIFLSNIFGVVDGILHGTGSQILGSMFAVFNAAVLALGGTTIMYTLLVSTMNTAHEGQMLGQKWSSIWVPVRSTIGLALLIPKASGYCLMQIIVMWIVVQGVGAADKVWDAALSYLNRGGAIVQAQQNPAKNLVNPPNPGIATGAQIILAGQTCMVALENQLRAQLSAYQEQKQNNSGPCAGTPSPAFKDFCQSTVPDFLNSVNVVAIQNESKQASYQVNMPNFDTSSIYSGLNGICGTINWLPITPPPVSSSSNASPNLQPVVNNLNPQEYNTMQMSRAIAIQQMYLDLSTIARAIVGNDPKFLPNNNPNPSTPNFSSVAVQQFGVPETANGDICVNNATPNCVSWGSATNSSNSAPMFSGTEFQGAIADYNGIMLPTLTLMKEEADAQTSQDTRDFIKDASTQGWIMAGSYFFDLVRLNAKAQENSNVTEPKSGLSTSKFDTNDLLEPFRSNGGGITCAGGRAFLCQWFNADPKAVNSIVSLIDGTGIVATPVSLPDLTPGKPRDTIDGIASSTVYGFTNNSTIVQLPGQPGVAPLAFADAMNIKFNNTTYKLPWGHFDCGAVKILFFKFCLGSMMGNLFYNAIIVTVYNLLAAVFQNMINQVIAAFLLVPLEGMAAIFKAGVSMLSVPGINPIVALANMGTYYINFVSDFWIMIIELAITTSLIPIFGIFIFPLIALSLPILLSWLGIMLTVGFSTAYYVPMVPYMIFTFGSVAWLMAVIEAMVAAPVVALGVTNPEGHEAFGKGEQAILILINVFLRPAMMIIGYITGIAVSYVSVWMINAGFDHAIGFMQGDNSFNTGESGMHGMTHKSSVDVKHSFSDFYKESVPISTTVGTVTGGYTGWSGVFAYFFSILMYTMLYITVVQKSFTLITLLPDKVLRWIGGQQESIGAETAQWGEETKGKIGEGAKEVSSGQQQTGKQISSTVSKAAGSSDSSDSGNVDIQGSNSTDSSSSGSGGSGGGGSGGGESASSAAEGAALL